MWASWHLSSVALSARLLFHPESIMAHFPLTACSVCCSCCCASAQPSSDALENLFLCQYPGEWGVCIIPMAFDGSRLYLSYWAHVTRILSLVTPCFSAYHCRIFFSCAVLLFELLPLILPLKSYSWPPWPSETAVLNVSDIPSDLARYKWEESSLSQFLFQRTQSCRKRNWALFTEVPDQTLLSAARARISLWVYPFANDFVFDKGDSVSI